MGRGEGRDREGETMAASPRQRKAKKSWYKWWDYLPHLSAPPYISLTCNGSVLWFRRWAWAQSEHSAPDSSPRPHQHHQHPAYHLPWRSCIQHLMLWKSTQPVMRELLLAHSWIVSGVFIWRWLGGGYAEVQEKSVNAGKLIRLLCDSWASFHMPNVWAGSDQGYRWLLAGSYYFGGTGHGKGLQFKGGFYAYPTAFPSASFFTVINSPIRFEDVIVYFCSKTLIRRCHRSPQAKWAHLTEGAGSLRPLPEEEKNGLRECFLRKYLESQPRRYRQHLGFFHINIIYRGLDF